MINISGLYCQTTSLVQEKGEYFSHNYSVRGLEGNSDVLPLQPTEDENKSFLGCGRVFRSLDLSYTGSWKSN